MLAGAAGCEGVGVAVVPDVELGVEAEAGLSDLCDEALEGITMSTTVASSDLISLSACDPARLMTGVDKGEDGLFSSFFFDLDLLELELELERTGLGGSNMICSTVVASDLLLLDLLTELVVDDFGFE